MFMKINKNLGYRKKVSAIVIDKKDNFLIVQLTTYGPNDWNFPGGGINERESEEEALLRELKEELGTDKFEVVKKRNELIKYDWPPSVIARRLKAEGKLWRGQEVRQFLARFTGENGDIKPDQKEIREISWIKHKELKNYLHFPNQWKITKMAIKELLR